MEFFSLLFICVVGIGMGRLKKTFHKIFKGKSTVNTRLAFSKSPRSKRMIIELGFFPCLLQNQATNNSADASLTNPDEEESTDASETFATDAFLDLEKRVYGDNWSIPYKRKSPNSFFLSTEMNVRKKSKSRKEKKSMTDGITIALKNSEDEKEINRWECDKIIERNWPMSRRWCNFFWRARHRRRT